VRGRSGQLRQRLPECLEGGGAGKVRQRVTDPDGAFSGAVNARVDVEVVQFVGVHLAMLDGGKSQWPVTTLDFPALQLGQRATHPDQDRVLGHEQAKEVQ
jgi:hypothetical protein